MLFTCLMKPQWAQGSVLFTLHLTGLCHVRLQMLQEEFVGFFLPVSAVYLTLFILLG